MIERTPPELRGWEWRYLHHLCHSDLLTLKGHTQFVDAASFSPDGSRIVTGGDDGSAQVWDAAIGAKVLSLKGHPGSSPHMYGVWWASFSPDGARIATLAMGAGVKFWDTSPIVAKPSVPLLAAARRPSTAAPDVLAVRPPAPAEKASSTAPAGAVKVEVVGLIMDKPGSPMRFGRMLQEGTSVTLLVSLPGKTIVDLDRKASQLTSFTDDRDADLSKAKNQGMVFHFGNADSSPLRAERGPDGRSCLVEVRGPGLPTPGASKIRLKGTLAFSCGAGEKTDEQKDVPLTDGTRFNAGPVPMTVIFRKNPGAGNFGFPARPAAPQGSEFTLRIEMPPTAIKSVAFFDADGKGIPIRASMSWSLNPSEATATETSYTLDRKLDKVTIKVRHVDRLETLTVPVDTTVGVGF